VEKKIYKKELKALVANSICEVTLGKRKTLESKMQKQAEEQQDLERRRKEAMENILNGSQFISLNSRRRSVRTFSRVEGSTGNLEFPDGESGTVLIHGNNGESGTVVVKDTNAEGDLINDAFGVDTVIIQEEMGNGTVIIKE